MVSPPFFREVDIKTKALKALSLRAFVCQAFAVTKNAFGLSGKYSFFP
jgi:hypothetical protein